MSVRDEEFTAYVAARRDHLRRLAYALCGDWHRADDLVQTALVRLYAHWPRVQRGGHVDAYVRRIVVRATIDETRRPWRRERATSEPPEHAAPAGLGVEDRSALLDALRALPPMQRRTVVLRHWLGLSVAETAADLGISAGTVKSHTSRALATLEAALAER